MARIVARNVKAQYAPQIGPAHPERSGGHSDPGRGQNADTSAMAGVETPLCRLLGIRYPVLSAGVGGGARAELVAAVSNAGGFGVLGASGMPPEALRAEVARTKTLTGQPFGVNIIIDTDPETVDDDFAFFRSQVVAAGESGAAAVVLFWGDPAPLVDAVRRLGMVVMLQVGSVEEATAAVEAGVDVVITQGVEAGGHVRGTTSIWELLPDAVDAVRPAPVVASGGIGDGAGFARALRLGAEGVSLGTRFVASDEANAHPEYKRRIVAATAADTVYVADLFDVGWPNAPHRVLRNRTYEEWVAAGQPPPGERPGEGTAIGTHTLSSGQQREWPRYGVGVATPEFDGDVDYAPLWAGESCSVVNDIRPAAEIVGDLVRDAEADLSGP
jgi:NAD(P)H-dependent flavin oxidoreductase YrpB (nitropropane dioxygenase family)